MKLLNYKQGTELLQAGHKILLLYSNIHKLSSLPDRGSTSALFQRFEL